MHGPGRGAHAVVGFKSPRGRRGGYGRVVTQVANHVRSRSTLLLDGPVAVLEDGKASLQFSVWVWRQLHLDCFETDAEMRQFGIVFRKFLFQISDAVLKPDDALGSTLSSVHQQLMNVIRFLLAGFEIGDGGFQLLVELDQLGNDPVGLRRSHALLGWRGLLILGLVVAMHHGSRGRGGQLVGEAVAERGRGRTEDGAAVEIAAPVLADGSPEAQRARLPRQRRAPKDAGAGAAAEGLLELVNLAVEGNELLHAVAVRQALGQHAEAVGQVQLGGGDVAVMAAGEVQLPAQGAHDAAAGEGVAGGADAGAGPHERRRRLGAGDAVVPGGAAGGAGAGAGAGLAADSAIEAGAGAAAGAAAAQRLEARGLVLVVPAAHCDAGAGSAEC